MAACAVSQAVQSRQKAIEHTKGAEVSGGEFERPIEYVGKIRVYVSRAYQEQRSDWKSQLTKVVRSANDILGPAFAVELEIIDTQGWAPACDPSDLMACLAELAEYDPADDVDWVVGLVAATPRFTVKFEDLGMASMPGRHFVLRDLYDPAEKEAIDEMFPKMAPSRRTEIYRERKRHKRLVVFLHEWAHTLGALHTRRDEVILYPAYDSEASSFSDENARLIDASLKDRFPFDPSYSSLREFLSETKSEIWWPGAREELLGALSMSGGYAGGPSAPAQVTISGSDDVLLEGVTPEDRARYAEAKKRYEADDLDGSWKLLAPLLRAYPDCYAIQHFGCSLAMHVGAREEAGTACRRAIDLAATE